MSLTWRISARQVLLLSLEAPCPKYPLGFRLNKHPAQSTRGCQGGWKGADLFQIRGGKLLHMMRWSRPEVYNAYQGARRLALQFMLRPCIGWWSTVSVLPTEDWSWNQTGPGTAKKDSYSGFEASLKRIMLPAQPQERVWVDTEFSLREILSLWRSWCRGSLLCLLQRQKPSLVLCVYKKCSTRWKSVGWQENQVLEVMKFLTCYEEQVQ